MKFIENKFYGVTTKGVLHTFIELYSNFPITFFNTSTTKAVGFIETFFVSYYKYTVCGQTTNFI